MTYLASSGLCIGAIACLANQSTARVGNALGLMGVSGGIAATLGLVNGDPALYGQILGKYLHLLETLWHASSNSYISEAWHILRVGSEVSKSFRSSVDLILQETTERDHTELAAWCEGLLILCGSGLHAKVLV